MSPIIEIHENRSRLAWLEDLTLKPYRIDKGIACPPEGKLDRKNNYMDPAALKRLGRYLLLKDRKENRTIFSRYLPSTYMYSDRFERRLQRQHARIHNITYSNLRIDIDFIYTVPTEQRTFLFYGEGGGEAILKKDRPPINQK